jgi:hypothetical protein
MMLFVTFYPAADLAYPDSPDTPIAYKATKEAGSYGEGPGWPFLQVSVVKKCRRSKVGGILRYFPGCGRHQPIGRTLTIFRK